MSDVYNYGVKIDVYNYVYINFGRMAGKGSRVPHNLQLYMYLDLKAINTRLRHVLNDGVKIMFWIMFWFMFTFIWADGQASAVESLKTQNSNMYLELECWFDLISVPPNIIFTEYFGRIFCRIFGRILFGANLSIRHLTEYSVNVPNILLSAEYSVFAEYSGFAEY